MSEITLAIADPGIALLTMRRPKRLNALTWEMIDEIRATLEELARDRSVRVLVLTGEGRGFCSGLDIRGDDAVGSVGELEDVYDRQEIVASLALALRALPQPVIAAVNGPAAGGGMALALASDIRICAQSARFNVAFVRIGLSGCDVGVSHLLPRLVGYGLASEWMLTGRQVGAEEAFRTGLANRVVADGEEVEAAISIGRQIARNSRFGIRMTKQVLQRNADAGSLEAAIELENRTQILASRGPQMREALAAFIEGREPRFD
jgi:enoyl-CoA hydratase